MDLCQFVEKPLSSVKKFQRSGQTFDGHEITLFFDDGDFLSLSSQNMADVEILVQKIHSAWDERKKQQQ